MIVLCASSAAITSGASWAQEASRAKKGLRASDAERVEEAFAAMLAELAADEPQIVPGSQSAPDPALAPASEVTSEAAPAAPFMSENPASTGIDKSVLAVADKPSGSENDHFAHR
jgi:hypothetical protein